MIKEPKESKEMSSFVKANQRFNGYHKTGDEKSPSANIGEKSSLKSQYQDPWQLTGRSFTEEDSCSQQLPATQNKLLGLGRWAIRRPSSLGVTTGISFVSRLIHPVKDPAHGQFSGRASVTTPHWELRTT